MLTVVHLAHIIDWCRPGETKLLVTIKQDASPIPLAAITLCVSPFPPAPKLYPTIASTWTKAQSVFLDKYFAPLPIFFNKKKSSIPTQTLYAYIHLSKILKSSEHKIL